MKRWTDAEIQAAIDSGEHPRVTQAGIDALVANGEIQYHVFSGTTMTVCCLQLPNGFTVIGQSACADPRNFNQELGQQLALKQAISKIWDFEGYVLRETIYELELKGQ